MGPDPTADTGLGGLAIGSGTVNETTVVILIGALVVLFGLALLLILVALRRTRRDLAATRQESAGLREQIELLAARPAIPTGLGEAPGFVITGLGTGSGPDPSGESLPTRIEGRLFVDIVVRESVVRAASLTHGVRRALSPESRNRIRFEMRRELKRTRKQRRADTKAAVREWEARQRAALNDDEDAA
jgi:hypothetical protein